MTPPPSVDVALARAHTALTEARDNAKLGHHAVAISRAYYATLYASLALLKSIGLEPKTDDGVHALIAHHFVRAGKLSSTTSRTLKHLEGDREIADYDFDTELTAADSADALANATRYVDEVVAILGKPTP